MEHQAAIRKQQQKLSRECRGIHFYSVSIRADCPSVRGEAMRSKLFVPGARPELFDKALASPADALSFDLEDSVPESGKQAAREQVADFLARTDISASGKLVIVRTNGTDSPHFSADLAAMAVPGVWLLNIPKIESVAQVRDVVAALEQAEAANG